MKRSKCDHIKRFTITLNMGDNKCAYNINHDDAHKEQFCFAQEFVITYLDITKTVKPELTKPPLNNDLLGSIL